MLDIHLPPFGKKERSTIVDNKRVSIVKEKAKCNKRLQDMADRFGTYMEFKRTIGKDMGKPIDLSPGALSGEGKVVMDDNISENSKGRRPTKDSKESAPSKKLAHGHFDKSSWEYWENYTTRRAVDKEGRSIVILDVTEDNSNNKLRDNQQMTKK